MGEPMETYSDPFKKGTMSSYLKFYENTLHDSVFVQVTKSLRIELSWYLLKIIWQDQMIGFDMKWDYIKIFLWIQKLLLNGPQDMADITGSECNVWTC